jgi:ABC-type uncharacterized transport system substrate-binding protein
MDKQEQPFQRGIEMGLKTAKIVRAVLVDNPRKSNETQEQYAERIMLLVGQQLARELEIRMKTQD